MAKPKLSLRELSLPEKITRAHQVVAALTGNADFPSPNPTLAQLTTAIDELETAQADAQAARQQAKTTTSIQNEKAETLERLFSQLSSYVENVSGGDEKKILNAGLDVRAEAAFSTAEPDTPTDLNVTAGDHDGELDVQWDKVDRARSYIIEISPDPPTPTSWKQAGVATRSQTTIDGLTSGTRYWLRVAAISATGQSGWSDPATKIAP
jgi:hypothetical protein